MHVYRPFGSAGHLLASDWSSRGAYPAFSISAGYITLSLVLLQSNQWNWTSFSRHVSFLDCLYPTVLPLLFVRNNCLNTCTITQIERRGSDQSGSDDGLVILRCRRGMDGGEGWCSIRCAGDAQDKTVINRIMLRFRPIAPKPAAGGPLHGGSPGLKENVIVSQRTKRKYVRVRRSTSRRGFNKSRGKANVASEDLKNRSAVTLQLLPENRITEQKLSSNGGSWCSKLNKQDGDDGNPLIRLNLNLNLMSDNGGPLDQTAVMPQRRKAVETWVTVEYESETRMDARGLGCTDTERLRNLEGDTCPGFVSDGLNRVVWVNRAFRKMVRLEEEEEEEETPEMEVRLVMRERLAYRALTCQVKVQYTWRKEKYSQRVPCDAWKMDGGGFAWRLDVKAALSLGRKL